MDAASVLASRRFSRTPVSGRGLQGSNRHSGLGRHTSRSKNAGVLGGKYPRRIVTLQNGIKLSLVSLLFTLTWVLAHFMRGHLRPDAEPTGIDFRTWLGPTVQRLEAYSYKFIEVKAHDSIARISYYLQTAILPSNVHGSIDIASQTVLPSTVLPSQTVLPSTVLPSRTVLPSTVIPSSNVLQSIDSMYPETVPASGEVSQESPPSSQQEKNSASQTSRPREISVPPRDFALNTEYISRLTSHTHSNLGLRQRFGLKVFSSVAGFDVGRTLGQSPAMALMDGGSNEQSCWIFPGSSGHLGIRLKERISVDKFTVDHLPRDILSDFAVLQAPRKMVLWGRVDGPENLLKAQLYQENMAMGDELSSLSLDSRSFGSRTYHRGTFIPLATFEYKLSGQPQSNVQTKEVPRALQSLQMDFEVVVLEILSNWGAPSTCLYRVRVHGVPLKGVALRTLSRSF